ncbi:hypothetical protein [Streptosporangium sp. NPDC051022]|uniref:hypothetical protein n=1 Tax=Streptosporangium sp. NPDC051022 TaxID=3155752 RepID=UPI00343E9E8F
MAGSFLWAFGVFLAAFMLLLEFQGKQAFIGELKNPSWGVVIFRDKYLNGDPRLRRSVEAGFPRVFRAWGNPVCGRVRGAEKGVKPGNRVFLRMLYGVLRAFMGRVPPFGVT